MRDAEDLAVDRGVGLRRVQHGGNEPVGLDLREIHRLVDAELDLRAGDPVLARLGEIEAAAAGGAQLGDHLLVVRQRHLHVDAGLGLEHVDHRVGRVTAPGEQAQGFGACGCGRDGGKSDGECGQVLREFHGNPLIFAEGLRALRLRIRPLGPVGRVLPSPSPSQATGR